METVFPANKIKSVTGSKKIDSWNKLDVEAILEPIRMFIPEEINKDQLIETKEISSEGSPEFVKERMGEISEAIDRKEAETVECKDEVQNLTEGLATVEICESSES